MSNYHHHSLALTDKEEAEFKKTGLGVKKIFMAMVNALNVPSDKTVDKSMDKLSDKIELPSVEEE